MISSWKVSEEPHWRSDLGRRDKQQYNAAGQQQDGRQSTAKYCLTHFGVLLQLFYMFTRRAVATHNSWIKRYFYPSSDLSYFHSGIIKSSFYCLELCIIKYQPTLAQLLFLLNIFLKEKAQLKQAASKESENENAIEI